ncbi:MAG: hypothetical protein HY804_07655 [Nitrospinae bacterium]|nr:hypothetical protein [Nitrospinota bacterium]
MPYGKLNLITGGVVIFLAAFGGTALGFTMDAHFTSGYYQLPYARMLMKAAHSHGMPFALFNLIVGVMVDRLALGEGGKKWLSRLAILALLMPVGLLLRGLTGGAMTFAPVVLLGELCFLASAALIIKGALKA